MDLEKGRGGEYLLIEGGDMVYSPDVKKNLSLSHLTLKGEAFFGALEKMDYDLFVPGELDLKIGLDTLGKLSLEHGVEAVQLNLFRQGKRIFKGYRKINKAGASILVTGVIAEEFIQKEYRDWSGYDVRDPRRELEELWTDKGSESDIFVIVSHIPKRRERLIARSVSFPAIFLSIHSGYQNSPVMEGKSLIVSIPDRGRYVGKLALRGKRDGNFPFLGYYLSPGGSDRRKGEKAGDGRSIRPGNVIRVKFEKISLDEDVSRDVGVEALLSGYREKIKSLRYESGSEEAYKGFSYCKECHAGKVKQWLSGNHARALETLMTRREEMNPDCLVCHSTGFGRGGYLPQEARSRELEGVGCEECHGPGKGHPDKELFVPGEKECRQCHNRDEKWDFKGARERIGCEMK